MSPQKTVAGQHVSESFGLCNKMHISAILSTCEVRLHLIGLSRTWTLDDGPGGSPALCDVAMHFAPSSPSSLAIPLSVQTPGTIGLIAFHLSQSVRKAVNKPFTSVFLLWFRTFFNPKKWVSNGGNSGLKKARGRVWGVNGKLSN